MGEVQGHTLSLLISENTVFESNFLILLCLVGFKRIPGRVKPGLAALSLDKGMCPWYPYSTTLYSPIMEIYSPLKGE